MATDGDEAKSALERDRSTETLVPQLYDELRRLAIYKMTQEAPGQTLSGTALVHEAYLRLQAESDAPKWKNEQHFFSAAAEAMRRILIDRVRAKQRLKRGENPEKVELSEEFLPAVQDDDRLLVINEALDELEAVDPKAAELVKLRFFVGLTMDEASQATGTPVRSLTRQWAYARAWLARHLSGAQD